MAAIPKTDHVSNATQILLDYEISPILSSPAELEPIYVSTEQSDKSLKGLAISYSLLPLQYRDKGCQLFEVPETNDNCLQYCGRGYSSSTSLSSGWWNPTEDWVQLADKTDFSCRQSFEKIFVYAKHIGRQWGDGTILEKMGRTKFGATPVFRFTDPHHPYITHGYGEVQSVCIRKSQEPIPPPFYRFESTYTTGKCSQCDEFRSEEDVILSSITPWTDIYEKLVKERVALQY